MPSRLFQPDLYYKARQKNVYNLDTIKMERLPKIQGLYIHTNTIYKLNSKGGRVGRSVMADTTKTTSPP